MSIIEKLGITPGPWEVYSEVEIKQVAKTLRKHPVMIAHCDPFDYPDPTRDKCKANAYLVAAAPENLSRDIEIIQTIENIESITSILQLQRALRVVKNLAGASVSNATGKSWEEAKALMEDES